MEIFETNWGIARSLISTTPLLLGSPIGHPPNFRGTWGKFGETRGWEKVACWSTKPAISLKRVKIGLHEKLLYWGPIESYQRSFERYRSRPLYAPPFPRLRFATPAQNSNRYYLRNGYSYRLQIWLVLRRVHPNKSSLKILEKRDSGRVPVAPDRPYWGHQAHGP